METSIAKLYRVRKAARIEKTAHAVIIGGSADYWRISTDNNLRGQGGDGTIKGLSPNALSRLRDAIARTTHKSPEYRVYGCCLTIPWGDKDPESPLNPTQEDASEIWREWTHNLGRLLDKLRIGAIYRVELQTRKAPHWHMMVYLPNDYAIGDLVKLTERYSPNIPIARKSSGRAVFDLGARCDEVATMHLLALSLLRGSWVNALSNWHNAAVRARTAPTRPHLCAACEPLAPPPPEIRTFDYCFDCIPLDGVKSGIAYLASHTTKHKQEQLGWRGKQWGYLGRRWLTQPAALRLETPDGLSPESLTRAFRLIRRWVKRNRFKTEWLKVCKPRRLLVGEGVEVFKGLVVRNSGWVYLFGVPPEAVIARAFDVPHHSQIPSVSGCGAR